MKQLITVTAAFLCSIVAIAQSKQIRVVTEFNAISSATGIIVEITQGDENKVTVSASNDEYIDNLKTEVDNNGMLKIYYSTNEKGWNNRNVKNLKLNAYVTFKSIKKLKASSGSTIQSTNTVNANSLVIEVSSGSNIEAAIKSTDCEIELSSGSSAKINGIAKSVNVTATSGSNFKATDLNTENCKASVSSGAEIKIAVSNKLVASASSGGSIRYKGNPEVEKKSVSSGGQVKQM
jgi:Putative auto-transporter adhesin, head GIN domain